MIVIKRTISVLLIALTLLSSLNTVASALYLSDPDGGRNVVDANDIKYNIDGIHATEAMSYSYKTDEISTYIEYSVAPGTYASDELSLKLYPHRLEVNSIENPYMVLCYKISSNRTADVDIKSSNAMTWMKNKVALKASDDFNTVIFNLSDVAEPDKFPSTDDRSAYYLLKPFGSHDKVITEIETFAIRYLAFFPTLEGAENFVFTAMSDVEYRSLYNLDGIDFAEGKESEIRQHLRDADALKKQIINSTGGENVSGTKYYVSPNGNDSNDGKSPSNAWKTIDKVNSYTGYNQGDGVYFERGGTWRDQLVTKNGLTYSAYGNGAKPQIFGSVDGKGAEKWTEVSENLWEYRETFPEKDSKTGNHNRYPVNIVFNNETAWGIRVYEDTNNPGFRPDCAMAWNGIDWVDNSAQPLTDQNDLDSNLEFYFNKNNSKLYLYCDYGNPGSYFSSIEICRAGNGVHSHAGGNTNIVIDNLCIKYAGNHGIGGYKLNNFTVQNCVFGFIGGNGLGNAIESWETATNYTMHHNYVYQAYDCAFTAQGTSIVKDNGVAQNLVIDNIKAYDNIAEFCNSGLELWLGTSKEQYENGARATLSNVDWYNNYTLYGGYGFSNQRRNKDGNFFFGGLGASMTTYDNVNIHHNINLFATSIGVRAMMISSDIGYNFHDNTYVCDDTLKIYNTAADLSDFLSGESKYYSACEYNIAKLSKYNIDVNSKYRIVSENYFPFGFYGVYDIIRGDTNGDGVIDPIDEILHARYIVEYDRGNHVLLEKNMDLDGDGVISPADTVLVGRKVAGVS